MNIIIIESKIQFKNPMIGQPTRAVEEHYYGRRIRALVNDKEESFIFKRDEMPMNFDEEEMIGIIEAKVASRETA